MTHDHVANQPPQIVLRERRDRTPEHRHDRDHDNRADRRFPLPKRVAFLPRYATVSAAANHRYRDALAVVDDPAPVPRPHGGGGADLVGGRAAAL